MTRFVAWALTAVLVIGLLTTPGVVGLLQSQQDAIDTDSTELRTGAPATERAEMTTTRPQMDNMSDEPVPAGGLVSSVVGMEESSVDSTVTIERFNTQFSAASSEADRAQVIASSLNASRERVTELEDRLETLEQRRSNGTITQGWFDVELSWLLAAAENQALVTTRLERAAGTVSRDKLARRDATVDHTEQVQDRIEQLRARETPEIHETTFDRAFYRDLTAFFDRFNEAADGQDAGALGELFEDNRVLLSIESDAGPPAVLSVRATTDGEIVDIRAGEHPDATHRMEMDEQTARQLIDSENPGEALRTAVADGEVTVTEIES